MTARMLAKDLPGLLQDHMLTAAEQEPAGVSS